MELIKKLETYRLERGITQERLAEMLDVTYLTVHRWLNKKTRPSKLYEYRIRKLLGGRR
jgi:transcriptional regulator with XRE-family HTH domain